MDYPRCKTCRWWEGTCGHPKLNPEPDKHWNVTVDGDMAGSVITEVHEDGCESSHTDSIHTGPDFGCIHHEPKDGG